MEVSADFSVNKLLLVSFRREARSATEPVGISPWPPTTNQIITIQTAASEGFGSETALLNQKCH
jgi:hypothetical protein